MLKLANCKWKLKVYFYSQLALISAIPSSVCGSPTNTATTTTNCLTSNRFHQIQVFWWILSAQTFAKKKRRSSHNQRMKINTFAVIMNSGVMVHTIATCMELTLTVRILRSRSSVDQNLKTSSSLSFSRKGKRRPHNS